jgi:hypothetical protein
LEAVIQALLSDWAFWFACLVACGWGAVADFFGFFAGFADAWHEEFGVHSSTGCVFHERGVDLVFPRQVELVSHLG